MDQWAVCIATEGTDKFIVRIDETYRDPALRGNRPTRVSVRFLGNLMLDSMDERASFEEMFESFLQQHDGAFVAGVARTGSYTFHAYTRSDNFQPKDIPIDEKLQPMSTVSIYDDPQWLEYES